MKKVLRKIFSYLPKFIQEELEWLLLDAAQNQIRITKEKKNHFRSYTQLKKHQKNIKLFFAGLGFALLFLLIGLIVGPSFFPKAIEAELYIPNGKGDILVGNVSKNQATIIFKTLDSANGNKPLATKAFVEVFSDKELTKLVRRSILDDYAVTHIIPIDSLQENQTSYIRITASDSSVPAHVKTISSWGDGGDVIKFYTTGEVIANCQNIKTINAGNNNLDEESERVTTPIAESLEYAEEDNTNHASASMLRILTVTNENYLQPGNKVQTIISWNTNLPSSTVLVYSEGSSGEKKELVISDKMQTKHAVTLTTLKAGTTYYFNAKSIDQNGNAAISEDYSLKTPHPQSTVVQQIGDSFMSIFRQIKPR